MKIFGITNQSINYHSYRNNTNSQVAQAGNYCDNRLQYEKYSYYPVFTGFFGKKKTVNNLAPNNDFGMNGNDYTVSYKMADIINRLDGSSVLLIGNPNSIWTKGFLKGELTREKSVIPHPKDIKTVYMIHQTVSNPTLIIRKNNDEFIVHGQTMNLTHSKGSSFLDKDDDFWRYDIDTIAKFDDVIETKDKLKLKFFKLNESNVPMYDSKYPVESFLSNSPELRNGLIRNKIKTDTNNDYIESNTDYGQKIPYRTFDDIAGMDDTIDTMKKKLLYPIMYPNAFKDDKNHGIILYGPSGTGKTLLALATIGEAKKRKDIDVHLVKINSRDLERKYVGESEELWRDVFEELEENQPSILMIDEIDALMGDRNGYAETTNNSNTSTVAQLLQSIDNLEKTNEKVWIIGTTNRPNAIDPAIKRSGRLGDMIEVNRPDAKSCREILDLYLKDKTVSEDFNRDKFSKDCYNLEYTGADIAQIVTDARNTMYERCGIYKKMNDGTYNDSDIEGLVYTQDDFDKAIKNQQINKNIKKRIGFKM